MRVLLAFIVVAAIAFGVWYIWADQAPPHLAQQQPVATVNYQCNGGKSITATLYNGSSTPAAAPGQPPRPGGSAHVVLSDGRVFDLPQTISADGVRYSNGDPNAAGSETFVFWSRGNGALVLENNQQQTYIGCISIASDPGGLPQVYENGQNGFSLRYPSGYTVDENYAYQAFGPGKDIRGVKFTIDPSIATGTNLSNDSYFSVEQLPQSNPPAGGCDARAFLDTGAKTATSTLQDGGTEYSFASTTGAAAGNRYEESVYAIPGTDPCIAVRYFIHYGVLQNYPAGAVRQFDEASLKQQFDAMRRALTVVQ